LVYQAVFSGAGTKERWSLKQAEKRVSQALTAKPGLSWTACVFGQPVGFAFVGLKEGHAGLYGDLTEIGVHPYFQRQGIGRELLKSVKARLEKKKIQSLYGLVYRGTAEKFFGENGFKRSKRSVVMALR